MKIKKKMNKDYKLHEDDEFIDRLMITLGGKGQRDKVVQYLENIKKEPLMMIPNNQEPMPREFAEVIDEDYWDLISTNKEK